MDILIRSEQPNDIESIAQVTEAAFADMPFSSHTERLIVDGLRTSGALTVSLVATVDGVIVGHVAFSRVTVSGQDVGWFGLGPVSVLPKFQRQGIGSMLIQAGLQKIRELGARGCVLEGSPAYYQRFGFGPCPNLIYADGPAEYFMALSFDGNVPTGNVEYHPAFYVTLNR